MPKYKKVTRVTLFINFNQEIEITNNTIQADVMSGYQKRKFKAFHSENLNICFPFKIQFHNMVIGPIILNENGTLLKPPHVKHDITIRLTKT